jgi:hypothetical protein
VSALKKMKNILLYLFVGIVAFIYFLPRYNLYFELENYLSTQKIIISNEQLDDSGFSLYISEGKLYFGDLHVADLDNAEIDTWLFYNRLEAQGVHISDAMNQVASGSIENLSLTQNIFNPLHVSIEAEGDFGTLQGGVDLLDQHLVLLLEPSQMLTKLNPFWLNRFKKTEEGYRFETQY